VCQKHDLADDSAGLGVIALERQVEIIPFSGGNDAQIAATGLEVDAVFLPRPA
jgi:hypothetical protein